MSLKDKAKTACDIWMLLKDADNYEETFKEWVRLEDAQQAFFDLREYGFEKDENLTKGAQELKRKILKETNMESIAKKIEELEARFEEVQLAIKSRKRHVDACKFLNKAPHAEMKFLGKLRKILKISVIGKT